MARKGKSELATGLLVIGGIVVLVGVVLWLGGY